MNTKELVEWIVSDDLLRACCIARLEELVSEVYQTCAPDLGWGDAPPDDDTFVDVMRDLVRSRLDEAGFAATAVWENMGDDEKRALVLRCM